MTDAPGDLEQLARRYLDLWQEQTAALISDPAVAEAVGRGYGLMSGGLSAFLAAAGSKAGLKGEGTTNSDHGTTIRSSAAAAPGTAAVAAAPVGPGVDPAELTARLAALEERVLRLEAALAAGGGRYPPSA